MNFGGHMQAGWRNLKRKDGLLSQLGCQDRLEEIFRCEFHHAGLDGRAISLQSRIGLFKADRTVRQTVPVIWLQFGWNRPSRFREI
jgi:hypothetical protein